MKNKKNIDKAIACMLFLSFVFGSFHSTAQLLTKEEALVDSVIMAQVEAKLVTPTDAQIKNTRWVYTDGMGKRSIEFSSSGKFKIKNDGAMGKYEKSKGTWYIYDRYVVLEVKKEKTPLYHVKHKGEMVMLDQQSIDVMRHLIMGFVAKDQLLSDLNEETIFSFLNAFKKND